jgi:hypothetical protein
MAKSTRVASLDADDILAALDDLDPAGLEDVLTAAMSRLDLARAVWIFEDWLARSNVGYLHRKARTRWQKVPVVRPRRRSPADE